MEGEALVLGDVVRMKDVDGAHLMTVKEISDDGHEVSCVWFDGPDLHEETFFARNLVRMHVVAQQ